MGVDDIHSSHGAYLSRLIGHMKFLCMCDSCVCVCDSFLSMFLALPPHPHIFTLPHFPIWSHYVTAMRILCALPESCVHYQNPVCTTKLCSDCSFVCFWQVRPIIGAVGGVCGVALFAAVAIAIIIMWKTRRRGYDLLRNWKNNVVSNFVCSASFFKATLQ